VVSDEELGAAIQELHAQAGELLKKLIARRGVAFVESFLHKAHP
jgi:hypothetical protein